MSELTKEYERSERTLKQLVNVRLELFEERERLWKIKQLVDEALPHTLSDSLKRDILAAIQDVRDD